MQFTVIIPFVNYLESGSMRQFTLIFITYESVLAGEHNAVQV